MTCVDRGCAPLNPGRHTVSHCTVCHRTFGSHRAGDRHRVGSFEPDERRCLSDDEMRERRMRTDRNGYWREGPPLKDGQELGLPSSWEGVSR